MTQARGFFERALALDPGNIDALVGTARMDAVMVGLFYATDDSGERLEAVEATITKALSLAPTDALAHYVWGIVQAYTNRAADGIAEFEKALLLNPNLAAAHALIGLAKIYLGRAGDTEGHVRQALRLSPVDTQAYNWYRFVGYAKIYMRADEEAVPWCRRSIQTNRNNPLTHFGLAVALAHVGRTGEADAAARAGLALDPNFTVSRFRDSPQSDNPSYLAQRGRFALGLGKVGVPEG